MYTLRSRHSGDLWLNLPDGPDGKPRSVRVPPKGVLTLNDAEYKHKDVQAAMRTGVLVLIPTSG
jgi:hypothetical protein